MKNHKQKIFVVGIAHLRISASHCNQDQYCSPRFLVGTMSNGVLQKLRHTTELPTNCFFSEFDHSAFVGRVNIPLNQRLFVHFFEQFGRKGASHRSLTLPRRAATCPTPSSRLHEQRIFPTPIKTRINISMNTCNFCVSGIFL